MLIIDDSLSRFIITKLSYYQCIILKLGHQEHTEIVSRNVKKKPDL